MARKKYAEPVKHEDLLTEEMKAAIRVKAKEEVLKAQKEQAAKEYLEKCKEEERSFSEPELATVEIMIDIPGYTKSVMVDGRVLDQGTVKLVTKQEADSLREIMFNAWRHERSNGNAHYKEYAAPKNYVVSGNEQTNNRLSRV